MNVPLLGAFFRGYLILFFLGFSGLFMPYKHFFMFHDVAWARHSKQACFALYNNVAPIRSRRFFKQH